MPGLKRPVNKRENPPEKVSKGRKGPMAGKMTMPSPTSKANPHNGRSLNRPVPGLVLAHRNRKNPVKYGGY